MLSRDPSSNLFKKKFFDKLAVARRLALSQYMQFESLRLNYRIN